MHLGELCGLWGTHSNPSSSSPSPMKTLSILLWKRRIHCAEFYTLGFRMWCWQKAFWDSHRQWQGPPLLGIAACAREVPGVGSLPPLRGKNRSCQSWLACRAASCCPSRVRSLTPAPVRLSWGLGPGGLHSPCFLGAALKPGKGAFVSVPALPLGTQLVPATGALSAKEACPLCRSSAPGSSSLSRGGQEGVLKCGPRC